MNAKTHLKLKRIMTLWAKRWRCIPTFLSIAASLMLSVQLRRWNPWITRGRCAATSSLFQTDSRLLPPPRDWALDGGMQARKAPCLWFQSGSGGGECGRRSSAGAGIVRHERFNEGLRERRQTTVKWKQSVHFGQIEKISFILNTIKYIHSTLSYKE